MGLNLPQLTTDVDCAPLGYAGLTVTFWLNSDIEEEPKPEQKAEKPEPWEGPWYRTMGRRLLRVTVPEVFTDSGGLEVIEVGNGKALWDLEHMPGFDPQIIAFALEQLRKTRDERLKAELKN